MKIDRKYQILDGAMQVFVDKGYANTRIDDIAEKISLSKGAIYHHFSSKKDLFLSLISHWETSCCTPSLIIGNLHNPILKSDSY